MPQRKDTSDVAVPFVVGQQDSLSADSLSSDTLLRGNDSLNVAADTAAESQENDTTPVSREDHQVHASSEVTVDESQGMPRLSEDTVSLTDSSETDSVFEVREEHETYDDTALQVEEVENEGYEASEKEEGNYWQIGVLLLVMMLIALARASHKKRFTETLKAVFSNRYVSQIMREEKVYSNRSNVLLLFAYVFSFSLFIYVFIAEFSFFPERSGIWYFLRIALWVIAAYVMKILVLKTASFIFETGGPTNEYIFNLLTFNQLIGVMLFPFVAGFLYVKVLPGNYLLLGGAGLLAVLLVHRVFRGTKIAYQNSVSLLYLFLYLCTLEILPLVVIIKVFSGY